MLDAKFIRANIDRVRAGVEAKGEKVNLDEYIALDKERLALLVEVDSLKAERNRVSEDIATEMRKGAKPQQKIDAMREVAKRIKDYDEKLKGLEEKLETIQMWIPNIPHESVPLGRGEEDNKVVRVWGKKPEFDFQPLPHWDIAEALDIVDFKRGAMLSASNFVVFKGAGARLARSIINFMLDLHTKHHGYREISPPALVNRLSMTGTGQLPKLEEDMYHCTGDDLFLIPTAEVPVTNLHRDEILEATQLPIYYTAYTPCFRREAGSYGKDTRGLNRIHQFDKVEMVKFVPAERSYEELESLVADAEAVLQAFQLHYRVSALCTGELSFSASKCYDLEAWSPGQNKWLEVSSCSNFEDFQARRMGIRYRPAPGEKPRFIHTLNGSGVALPRTIIAILETYQTGDGKVKVPEVLVPYMDGLKVIE
jgi:seryl-tRNA synthetase